MEKKGYQILLNMKKKGTKWSGKHSKYAGSSVPKTLYIYIILLKLL